ncbi:MAG: hemerythrin domain-containing protein [Hydrogenophaga sp.]|uniref:hemerythrin domain-containing protein n=1 Tax=Hydrogenophaga sp. TaxID=1904254 RepID=UPI001D69C912|nr:hemerythrin domain-containing protein [Hydrogenophaga sp.]MBX3608387.1 hemerythrin domain-containing protein [Hydrogenophaga sp.]
MQVHPIETAAIAAAAATGEGRFNIYASIHKALRSFMADTLLALGRADASDDQEVRDACDRVVELVEFCEHHVAHENQFIHPALQARCPGVCDAVAADHEDHLRHIAHLGDAARALASVPASMRPAALQVLYLALALFVADNFQHMHSEETQHNAALWSTYTDLELLAIHDQLVGSIPPQEMMLVARWMLPSVSAMERTLMVNDMQGKAPPEAVEAVMAVARQHLNDRDWAKLARSVNLPPVPGLVMV